MFLRRSFSFFLLLFANAIAAVAGDPVISEFMASNQNGITDEDGDRSDWIEIRNPDANAVSLNGWFLTDTAANKSKWMFPNVTLAGNSYLLVWASGKNRRVAGQPLHTNFNLSADGEYLALVKPDGATATTEFAPQYPAQFPNVAYGTSTTSNDVIVVDKPTAVRAFVPADNTLGVTWRPAAFDDSAWLSGTFAVGFMNYTSTSNPNLQSDLGIDLKALTTIGGTGRNAFMRAHFNVPNPASVTRLTLKMNYDDGFYAWINGAYVANSPGAPAEAALSFNSPAGQSHGPGVFDTFDISSKITTLVQGDNVLAIQALNTNNTSSDLFAWPQLIISVDSGGTGLTGYFTAATPGVANGGTNTIQLPQTVAPSRPAGTFTAPFDLTLGGADANQEIRYTISDPSGSGATLAEPTIASTLYTAPITISTSKLIRAAIFDRTNGQKSSSKTLQYLLLETGATNNTSNFSSILPIVVADDHGAGQPVDGAGGAYTTGLFYVFDTVAGTASLTSTPSQFSRVGLRVRGSSSAGFPKKSYGMETRDELNGDRDLPLLGLPTDSDWVLNGPWLYDDTYIHNAFINEISRQCGRWASRTKLVEMFTNQNGGKLDYADYAGVYVLTEKIKSSNARVNIVGLESTDNTGDAVTGGYIFKIDRADPDEVNWQTTSGVPSADRLVMVEPDPQADTPQQISFLQSYVQNFDTTLLAERNAGFTTRNYRNFIDVPSWIDHHILNSLAYNVDALRLSAYFFKDRGGKINAGPLWDADRALGSDDGRDSNPQSWANITYFFDRDWWGRLFQDPDFVQAWVDRWQQLRAGPFAQANLNAVADNLGAQIGNAAGARDAARWTDNAASGGVYLNEIAAMKNWLNSRTTWIDAQMPAAPTASVASGVVTAGTTVALSGGTGTIRYTLDGSDPRPPGGAAPGNAAAYTGPLTINQTTVVTTRRQLPVNTRVFTGMAAIGTNWSGLTTRVYLVNEAFAAAGDIAVTEINYHPLGPTAAESALLPGVTADEFEFLEIQNIGARRVNLFEVQFAEGKPFKTLKLAPFSLDAGERGFVVRNRAAFEARYGTGLSARIVGQWEDGALDDSGEAIELLARDGTGIQSFAYGDASPWPGRADGKGSTLEYAATIYTNAAFNDPLSWRSSSEFHGSPGAAGTGPDNSVTLNEILSNSALPFVDTIELRNNTAGPIDVSGWYVSNAAFAEDADDYKQYRIANGTTLPAGGYLVLDETDFNPNGPWNPSAGVPGPGEFSFDGNHDNDAWLLQGDAGGKLTRFVDHVSFGPARLNETWGRRPNGVGPVYPMAQRTCVDESSGTTPKTKLGAANSEPRVGPLIFSEIHHSPAGGNGDLEFVELRNPTASAEALAFWRLRGDVDFDFTTESIPAGGVLVVVSFSPDDAVKSVAFRNAYSIPSSVPLVGPWQSPGQLTASGETILYRAGVPPPLEPGYHPLTIEDASQYAASAPWPPTTSGLSLNRRGTGGVGDDPTSWTADVPSPGTIGPTYPQWRTFFFPAGGAGSADGDDPDSDGATNAREYALRGNPLVFEQQALLQPTLTVQANAGGGTREYVFTYQKPLDRPGAAYAIQQSPDLATWTTVADTVIGATLENEIRQGRVTVGSETPQLFFRLRAQIAP
jgi:hypothetical protein